MAVRPKGPKGQKRLADVVGAAVTVAKVATGEIEEMIDDGKDKAAVEFGRKGGKARVRKMPTKRRQEIARKAAGVRWGNNGKARRDGRVPYMLPLENISPLLNNHYPY